MNDKKMAINKDICKVEDGRVYIESQELANAIQNGNLDLFVDEEAASTFGFFCKDTCAS